MSKVIPRQPLKKKVIYGQQSTLSSDTDEEQPEPNNEQR